MEIKALNLEQFNREVNKFAEVLVPKQFSLFIRGLAFKILRGVVRRTPVKTGRARGNWQVNVGSITSEELERLDKAGNSTIREGGMALAKLRKNGIGQIIYIFNNVPYIIDLEDGHSQEQAPVGMVKVTFAELAAGFSTSGFSFVETAGA